MEYRIDDVDKRILYRVAEDARNTSAPEIAEELNVSPGTIRNRLGRLEEHDVVGGYHAIIDYERADGMLTNLIVCNAPIPEREALATQVLDVSGVINVRELMTGRGNLHVTAVGTDTDDLTRIARTISNLGVDIVGEDLLQRELHAPYRPFGPEDERERSVLTDVLSLAGDAEVLELSVEEDAPVAGKTLKEAGKHGFIDDESLIIAIERDGTVLTPRGHTEVRPGDLVSMLAHEETSGDDIRAFERAED